MIIIGNAKNPKTNKVLSSDGKLFSVQYCAWVTSLYHPL